MKCLIKLLAINILLIACSAYGQVAQLLATVTSSIPSITLTWTIPGVVGDQTRLYRKLPEDMTWSAPIMTWTNVVTNSWTDFDVQTNVLYEYRIKGDKPNGVFGILTVSGYVSAGIGVAPVEGRGRVLVAIDDRFSDTLAPEIQRFMDDLAGDGWTVLSIVSEGGRHMFPSSRPYYQYENGAYDYDTNSVSISSLPPDTAWTNAVWDFKSSIRSVHTNTPLKALVLLGHLPVPYSGRGYHGTDHEAGYNDAYPMDAFYADFGTGLAWTDSENTRQNSPFCLWMEGRNDPFDGKFDQTIFNADPAFQFGRIDFFGMGEFSQEEWSDVNGIGTIEAWPFFASKTDVEQEFLRRYLNKHHAFRAGKTFYNRRALLQDSFNPFTMENVGCQWATNGVVLFGAGVWDYSTSITWYNRSGSDSYLWGAWQGNGVFPTSVLGNSSGGPNFGTAGFFLRDTKVVFGQQAASFHEDWAVPGSWARSSLCNLDTLTAVHDITTGLYVSMALGATIGEAFLDSEYRGSLFERQAVRDGNEFREGFRTLMGDPTLRLHVVPAPTDVRVARQATNDLVNWSLSNDTNILGYQVLHSSARNGPFTNEHTLATLLGNTVTNFASAGTNTYYQVRALRWETVTNSGTYINTSLGTLNTLRFRDAFLNSAGDQMTFELVGPVGLALTVEASTNMATWAAVESFALTNGSVTKTYISTNVAQFFRARGTNDSIFYSDNVIGYYHVDNPGTNIWRLVGMQLKQFGANANTLGRIVPTNTIPGGTRVHKLLPNNTYDTYTYSTLVGRWSPSNDLLLNPGEAFWLEKIGTTQAVNIAICGEVPQGNLRNSLPLRYSMIASLRPFGGAVNDMMRTYLQAGGDNVQRYNYGTQAYETSTYSNLTHAWGSGVTVPYGEGFWVIRTVDTSMNWDDFFTAWPDL